VLEDGSDKGIEDIDDGTSVGRILDNTDIKLGSAVLEGVTGYCDGCSDKSDGDSDGNMVGSTLKSATGDRLG